MMGVVNFMVELIVPENNEKYDHIISFLKAAFQDKFHHDSHIYIMKTQRILSNIDGEYLVAGDWTVKLEDDKLFIISDHICSTIDLKEELPFEVTVRRI